MFRRDQARGSGRRAFSIGLGSVNKAAIALAALVAFGLLWSMGQSIMGYRDLQTATRRYISCQQSASEFLEAAELLSRECRYFALTGDVSHAEAYVEELRTNRHREKAIDALSEWLSGEALLNYLKQSLIYSNTLTLEECYAMRLMADVFQIEPGDMPEAIVSIPLDAKDAAGSGEDKRSQAMELLFGERADYLKKQTERSTKAAVDKLVSKTLEGQVKASDAMDLLLQRQRALTILLIVLLLLVVMLAWLLVIKPMREGVRHINEHRTLPLSGSREMMILANAYNDMFDRHERDVQALNHSATHDALTGLYNRAAFDAIREGLDGGDVCLLLVDIDHFKDFNDDYGHAMGDKVLRRVSRVLTGNFRSEDFVGRIGGDEFCVVMRHAGTETRERVAEKAARINAELQQAGGDVPAVSVSIGAAFGDRANPQGDIVKDADTALYRVKRAGRADCRFYGD